MSRQTWKATERAIAACSQAGNACRCLHSRLSRGWAISGVSPRPRPVTGTRTPPRRAAMAQAEAAATGDQVPVAVLHEAGRRHADNLCLLRLADLARLLAEAKEGR